MCKNPFLFEGQIIVCIYHILFIYSSSDRHKLFPLLATVNNAANIGIQISFEVPDFNSFGYTFNSFGCIFRLPCLFVYNVLVYHFVVFNCYSRYIVYIYTHIYTHIYIYICIESTYIYIS